MFWPETRVLPELPALMLPQLLPRIAGEVKDFDVTHYLSAKDARRMDIFIHYGMAAAIQAVKDAGIET